MNLAITVYLIGLLDNLSFLSGFFIVSALIVLVISLVACGLAHSDAGCNHDKKPNAYETRTIEVSKKAIRNSSIVVLVAIIISSIIPSKTDMYIMTGLVVGEKLLTSEKGNELLDKSYLLLVSKIEKSINETTEGGKQD